LLEVDKVENEAQVVVKNEPIMQEEFSLEDI